MANNKTFVIQIDGIDKAYEDLGKLSDRLGTIDIQIGNSKISTLISEAFGEASQVVSGFGKNIDNLAAAVNGLQPLIAAVVTLQKLNADAISTIQTNIEKQVERTESAAKKEVEIEKAKIENIKTIAVEGIIEKGKALRDMDEQRLKDIEKFNKKMEDLSKVYGSEIKYTEDSKKTYTDHYAFLEKLYEEDADKLKKTLADKEAYQKGYVSGMEKIQEAIDETLKISKDGASRLIKDLKNLSDIKKDASLYDIIIQKENIKAEESLQSERNARIADLEVSALEHNKRNFLGLNTIKKEESKANYEAIKELRIKNIADSKEEAAKIADAYDQMAKAFEKGSTGEALILEEKKNKLYALNEQILKDESAVHDAKKAYNDALVKQNKETIAKLTEYWGQFKEGITGIQGGFKSIMDEWVSDINERLSSVSTEYTEIVAKHKDSLQKIEVLNKEAESASGGRAIVAQEQLARQMEANQALADQEADLKKKKEKLEEEKAKKEKLLKKVDLGQKLIEGIANTALAVTKALAAGPFIGQILAGIAAAAGAVQTGIIARQLSKLEDGGLLRGKRHSQGGMRIEGSNIEVEGDEFVVNRISTRKNLGLIDYINKQRRELSPNDLSTFFARNGQHNTVQQHTIKHMYEAGGQLTNLEVIDSATAPDSDKVLEAISRINFQPVVSVVDIANTQSSIVQVKDIAGV